MNTYTSNKKIVPERNEESIYAYIKKVSDKVKDGLTKTVIGFALITSLSTGAKAFGISGGADSEVKNTKITLAEYMGETNKESGVYKVSKLLETIDTPIDLSELENRVSKLDTSMENTLPKELGDILKDASYPLDVQADIINQNFNGLISEQTSHFIDEYFKINKEINESKLILKDQFKINELDSMKNELNEVLYKSLSKDLKIFNLDNLLTNPRFNEIALVASVYENIPFESDALEQIEYVLGMDSYDEGINEDGTLTFEALSRGLDDASNIKEFSNINSINNLINMDFEEINSINKLREAYIEFKVSDSDDESKMSKLIGIYDNEIVPKINNRIDNFEKKYENNLDTTKYIDKLKHLSLSDELDDKVIKINELN